MDPLVTSELLVWAESMGLPATIGVILLVYILKILIPAQQKLFQEALKQEQDAHAKMIERLSDSNEKAFTQFASVLTEQNRQMERLAEAVNKLHGMFLADDGSNRAVS